MTGRDEARVKPVFLRNGEPIPVWELAKMVHESKTAEEILKATGTGNSRSQAARKAWETIRRNRGLKQP